MWSPCRHRPQSSAKTKECQQCPSRGRAKRVARKRTSRGCVGVPGAVAATEPGREGGWLLKYWRPSLSRGPPGELAEDEFRGRLGRRACWAWCCGLSRDTFSMAESTVFVASRRADAAGGSYADIKSVCISKKGSCIPFDVWCARTASLRLLRSASIWASWRLSMVAVVECQDAFDEQLWCAEYRQLWYAEYRWLLSLVRWL